MTEEAKKFVQNEILLPALVLFAILNLLFFPVIWGGKTLISSAGDAPSIMPYGAYESNKEFKQMRRSNDDGAPAWFSEPGYALLHLDYFVRPVAPLWNPFNGFGAPMLANMQSQPFNPLVLVACLSPSPGSADLFVLLRLLVAGILTNLYLRRFVGGYGAIFGAISFMLTGYFVIFLNMPEISVSIWIPGLLLALEFLAEAATHPHVVWTSVMTALVLLGGMPEVSFLVLAEAGFYFLLRLANLQKSFKQRYHGILSYIIACICGIVIAAPQIFPFLEYIQSSSNTHLGGVGAGGDSGPGSVFHLNFPAHFLNYLTPFIYGPLGDTKIQPGFGYDGFNGYWGVLTFSFALVALFHTFSKSRKYPVTNVPLESTESAPERRLTRHQRHLAVVSKAAKAGANKTGNTHSHDEQSTAAARSKQAPLLVPIVSFFLLIILFCLGKKFGSPLLSWASSLPLLKLVVFWKYSEPLIGFSLAVLAAIGFDSLASGKLRKTNLFAGFGTALAILIGFAIFDKRFIWGDHAVHMLFDKVFGLACALIACVTLIGWIALVKPTNRMKSCRLILVLLCAELSLCFLLPQFFWIHQLAAKESDPYKGAPYVRYLQSRTPNGERVLGFDGVLFPNWSSAFQLHDVRNLDAILPSRYLTFVRSFATDQPVTELADDNISNRFNGMETIADPLYSKAPKEQLGRLWYLSSVKYLLSMRNHFIGPPSKLTQQILQNARGADREHFRLDAFTIDKDTRYVIFQHPSANRELDTAKLQVIVPEGESKLNFAVAMSPEVQDTKYGDGMTFKIDIVKDDVHIKVFEKYIDPKNNSADRRWIAESVDLNEFAGKEVTLELMVDGGPNNNTVADWGGWADLRFAKDRSVNSSTSETDASSHDTQSNSLQTNAQNTWQTPKLAYDKEIQIYETQDALPRAALFYDYKTAKDDAETLKLLKSNSFDVSKSIVLDGTIVDQADKAILPLPLKDKPKCDAQEISTRSSITVKIQVNAKHDGMLMLNDQFYPGWNVYVDGMREEMLRADYLFRAVAVKEGPHEVVFRYEPFSFYLGLCLCAFAVFALSAYGFFVAKKH